VKIYILNIDIHIKIRMDTFSNEFLTPYIRPVHRGRKKQKNKANIKQIYNTSVTQCGSSCSCSASACRKKPKQVKPKIIKKTEEDILIDNHKKQYKFIMDTYSDDIFLQNEYTDALLKCFNLPVIVRDYKMKLKIELTEDAKLFNSTIENSLRII
jgi:hypothetical protein